MALADRENRILVSADTDFGELLAVAPVLAPSVIVLRRTDKTVGSVAAVLSANLDQVADDLAEGALVVIGETRIRAHRLPMKPADEARRVSSRSSRAADLESLISCNSATGTQEWLPSHLHG